MANYILVDFLEDRENLLPLTYTRPVSKLRCGILTLDQKWKRYLGCDSISFKTEPYLQKKFKPVEDAYNIYINATVLPGKNLAGLVKELKTGELLQNKGFFIAAHVTSNGFKKILQANTNDFQKQEYQEEIKRIRFNWDLFTYNGEEIKNDFNLLTQGRQSAKLSHTNTITGSHPVFVEEGAVIEAAIINTADGPVYIGRDSEVMEGAMIRGPFALGEHSTVKMGAKIYANTSIGPHCKVGGEVNNSIFSGYSNKAHDGFLGQAVIGEWCNIGADSNNSNLKNNYEKVKIWNYPENSFISSGLQFCGLIMGDHSKCGINTMFNTGTTLGVSCNIYGGGFPRTFIPSFSWGGAAGITTYRLDKALSTAKIVMARRNIVLDKIETEILEHVFKQSAKFRK